MKTQRLIQLSLIKPQHFLEEKGNGTSSKNYFVYGELRETVKHLDCLKLFKIEDLIDVILENTNIVTADILKKSAKYIESVKYLFLKLTTQEEISAFPGFIY